MNTAQHAGKSNFERRAEWATPAQIQATMVADQVQYDRECIEDQEPDFEALWEQYCHDAVVARDYGQPEWAY